MGFDVAKSVSDLIAPGGLVLDGLGVRHAGKCGGVFVVEGNCFTGLKQTTLTCPYCGEQEVAPQPPYIHDCRPSTED